jgi:hypothetical protein
MLIHFVSTFFSNSWFRNVLFAYFGTEVSYQNFRTVFREFIEHTSQFIIESVLHVINFILCWSMNIQNNDIETIDLSVLCMTSYH